MTPPRNEYDGQLMPQTPLGHIDRWESAAIDYVDGRLSPSAVTAIEDHISTCRACREALADQERMATKLQSIRPVGVPADLELRVLDRLLPAPVPIRRGRSAQPGRVRRYLDGFTRRPWVPAAIAAVVVLVALAGSSDVIRSGVGGDTLSVDAGSSTRAEQGYPAAPPSGLTKSTLTTSTAQPSAADLNAGTGDTAISSEVLTSDTTAPQVAPSVSSPAGTGSQGPTETVAATGDTVAAAADAVGSPPRDAASLPPTVWVSLEAPAGNAGAAVTIEQTTGLQPLPEQVTPGVPVYAAFVRRGDLDLILQYLADAGLAVALSDAPAPQLDQALTAVVVQQISGLPLIEAVSPQGDTLSASTVRLSTDSPDDYVVMVLAPVR